jgi:hypothetical protein
VHNLTLALGGAWKVLAVGLVLGAGLPLVFALGIRGLALGRGGDAEVPTADGTAARPHPVGLAAAALCFGVVVLGVVLGITYVVAAGFGHTLSFSHGYPTIS